MRIVEPLTITREELETALASLEKVLGQ
jgi:4-aminobutyrate aminotransferase-like enzyme